MVSILLVSVVDACYTASGIVEIVISDLIQDMYATVLENIRLNVVSREEESDHIIPPDTTFTWQVIHPNGKFSCSSLLVPIEESNLSSPCSLLFFEALGHHISQFEHDYPLFGEI